MIRFIQKIQNCGINSATDLETIKRVRLVNSMSIMTIIIAVSFVICSFLYNWPLSAKISLPIMTAFTFIPVALNRLKKFSASGLFFIFSSYAIIISLSILFGPELHFQYYLIGGIGIPLIFLGKEIGIKRIFLSVVAIPFWIYLEWHFSVFEPFIAINETYHYPVRLINDLLVFLTVFSVAFFFVKESNSHLEKIRKKTIQLEEINKQLEQFSHIVSHDLKNPLGNIWLLIQLAKEEHSDKMSAELKELCSYIEDSSKHSIDLISSILEYSRAGNAKVKITSFGLSELLDKIKTFIEIPDGFKIQYDTNLPVITGSYIQLEQVLSNLIGNAIKYHDKANGLIKITLEQSVDNEIKILVTDDGPGINEKYHDSIFNLFETVAETKRADSTGVGLAIVKKLVEQSGGKLGVISDSGKGSTFWFTWPVDLRKRKQF